VIPSAVERWRGAVERSGKLLRVNLLKNQSGCQGECGRRLRTGSMFDTPSLKGLTFASGSPAPKAPRQQQQVIPFFRRECKERGSRIKRLRFASTAGRPLFPVSFIRRLHVTVLRHLPRVRPVVAHPSLQGCATFSPQLARIGQCGRKPKRYVPL